MNRLFAGLAMALLMVAVVGVYLWLEVGEQREGNAALEARITALESARGGANPRQMAQDAALPPAPADATVAGPAPAGAGGPRGAASGERALLASVREMLASEEGRDLVASFGAMALQRQYPDLEKAVGLTPEEADKLLNILARHRVDEADPALRRARGPSDPAERERLMREQQERMRANEEELMALLGDRYPKWQEYDRGSQQRLQETYAREAQARLRDAISSRDNPMSDTTFQAFVAAVDAEERRFNQEKPIRSPRQQVDQMPEMHQRMTQAASAHLDAAQLERYRRHLAEQETMMRGAVAMLDDDE